MLKFVYIQNFELILDILEHPKPSIFSLKQPGRLAVCYLEKLHWGGSGRSRISHGGGHGPIDGVWTFDVGTFRQKCMRK